MKKIALKTKEHISFLKIYDFMVGEIEHLYNFIS